MNENYWIPAFTLIMGLDNDETPEDSWETIRLINELEHEQPDSMFTATALTFVPIGLLEKSDFFNIGNEMTPAQLGVLYKTWQHNFKYGIQKFMTKTGSKGPQRYSLMHLQDLLVVFHLVQWRNMHVERVRNTNK